IGGVVLDYDGTLVDTRHRFEPPQAEIVRELTRILDTGAVLSVATGRGRSVREAFQKAIPASLWKRVIIGYYNGAEIGSLDDDLVPSPSQEPAREL
ncbi:HAD hydrolase family protein, partial [Escherichia coli]